MKRSKEDWLALIADQAASGLTANQFCLERNVNPTYFSLRKQALTKPVSDSAFIKVKQVPSIIQPPSIRLLYGHCEIVVPPSIGCDWLISLLRGLA